MTQTSGAACQLGPVTPTDRGQFPPRPTDGCLDLIHNFTPPNKAATFWYLHLVPLS